MEMNAQPTETQEESKLSMVNKFLLIFTSPEKFFKNLSIYPDWLIPAIVLIIIAISSGFLIRDQVIDFQIEKIKNNTNLNEDLKERQIESTEKYMNSTLGTVIFVVMPIISTLVIFIVIAGVFLFTGNTILGGTGNFKSILAVTCWSYMVNIPEMIVKLPLIISKNSMHVYISLAVLFDPSEADSVLFKIADATDIFVLWRLILFSFGFGAIYKFTQGKSLTVIFSLYVIWLIISISFSTLIGGMFG